MPFTLLWEMHDIRGSYDRVARFHFGTQMIQNLAYGKRLVFAMVFQHLIYESRNRAPLVRHCISVLVNLKPFSGFAETLHIEKKKEYVDPSGPDPGANFFRTSTGRRKVHIRFLSCPGIWNLVNRT
jgi:hypothetical protein